MAKRRTPAKPKTTSISVKGGPQWGKWVYQFAELHRMDVSKFIDSLLVEAAAARGFPPPPKRSL